MQTPKPFIHPLITPALCLLPLVVYALLCGSTGHDDSHITFWQARSLLEHGAMLNYNGERIEQSSSLLMVLLTALLAFATPLPVVDSGYLLNIAGAVTTLFAVWSASRRAGLAQPWLPVLLTALTPYFAYWAYSGMETSLAAATVMLFLLAAARWLDQPGWRHSLLLALAALALAAVRPEMALAGPACLAATALLQRRPALLLFIAPFAALLLWRHSYFGLWLPNPVYAKSGDPGMTQLLRGMDYCLRLFRHPLSAIGVALTLCAFVASCAVCLRQRCQPRLLTLCCLWVLVYSSFVITSGGDWMKEGRFWVPLVAPLWLGICLAFTQGKTAAAIRYGMPLLLASYTPFFINTYSFGTPWWNHSQQRALAGNVASFFEFANREHLRDWPALHALQKQLHALQPSTEKPLLIMSKQMGMVNYHLFSEFSGAIKIMDMAGLVDNSLRNCAVMAQDGFDKQGLRINYRKFFERLPQAETTCGLRAPDIIYDIYGWGETTPLPDFLRSQGYRIIFNQTGRVDSKPGIDITAQELVAVRSALLTGKPDTTETVDFNRLLSPDKSN